MPLEPYQYRPITPPSTELPVENPGSGHSRNTSGSSVWSTNSSPDSVDTRTTTPPRSPLHQHGPRILPKIRTQDQSVQPSFRIEKHRRTSSTADSSLHARSGRPTPSRSTTVPPEYVSLVSPTTSVYSPFSAYSGVNSGVNSPISITPSYQRRPSHSRSISTSIIDDSTLERFGYPYRRLPSYITGARYNPSVIPGSSTFVAPPVQRPQPQVYDALPEELVFKSADDPVSTLNDYLTGSNPAVNLVRQVNTVLGRGMHMHFWWDIRNLRTWEDFNIETINEVPSFPELLSASIPEKALPQPYIAPYRLNPDSEVALQELCRDFYATKVNAALKATLGHVNYISMRQDKSRDGPHFVSNYVNDATKTLAGNGHGRVVGLVKSFERWNTGMRNEAAHRKVKYLEGLSHLHRYMREHECRYGFIMTEIELVCVRAGTDSTPYFGFLELAPTIATATQEGLTASLALWYLHMLARDTPLPGQCGWKLDVGAPAAMTRMHIMEKKDDWIPDPQIGEKRDAKTARGWVMPKDPWNKKKELKKAGNR